MLVTACSTKSPTTPAGGATSIAISTATPTLSVAQAASGTATISVARTTYTGDVALTAEGLPSGITATFEPSTLSGSTASSTLSLQASGTAAVGTSTMTVRARGTGVSDATTPIAITVTTAGAGAGVSLAASPVNADILPGDAASTVVTFTRTGGFTGGVTFTVSGAPTGMTTTFSSANPVTAATGTLSITTTAATTPGTYTLTLRAASAGITEATATWTVVIAPLPVNAFTWRFCDPRRVPSFFAYQNGLTGVWRKANDVSSGVFSFNVDQPQVGIAAVSSEGGTIVTRVRYLGLSEIAAAADAECATNPAAGSKTVTGTVSGLTQASEAFSVGLGNVVSATATPTNPAFTLLQVQDGPRDLIAVLQNFSAGTTSRMLVQRGLNPPDGSAIGAVDMFGPSSFAPASAQVTVTAPNDGVIRAQTEFETATSSLTRLIVPQLSSGTPATYQGVPAAILRPTDVQRLRLTQEVASASLSRSALRYLREPVAVTLTLPPDPATATITVIAGTAYPRASASGVAPTAYSGTIELLLQQTARLRSFSVSATAAGRTSATNYVLTTPDLSTVPGWNATWALAAGTVVATTSFTGASTPGSNGFPAAGTTIFGFLRNTTITLP